MRNSYGFSSLAIALAALAASPALAEDEYNVTTGYTLDGAGLGVHGVDPVVLSTLNAVAPGDAASAVVHDGVAYYFASKLSAERFQADPDRYLPITCCRWRPTRCSRTGWSGALTTCTR